MEKKALGRGLDALLPTVKPVVSSGGPGQGDVQPLKVESIVPNRFQPRQIFHPQELTELAASIRENGLLQPILVRRKGDGTFELISGERRWRATKEAGFETIPAIVRNCSDQEASLFALVENIQREDLNPMETARAYARMIEEFQLTQDAIAQKVGRDRSSVANALLLLNLPSDVQALVDSGSLSAGHAKVLLGLPQSESQSKLAQLVVSRGLSVRATEKLVTHGASNKRRGKSPASRSDWTDVEARLQKRFGTKVEIDARGKSGTIIIHYFSEPELDGLLEQLLA